MKSPSTAKPWKVLAGNPFGIINQSIKRVIHFESAVDARFVCEELNKLETNFERCARCDASVHFKEEFEETSNAD